MPRLLFEKTGNSVYVSHLDLMRIFQRAFKRAGLPLTHSKGFNPRPSVSIALPLSVGVESRCELLDFDLEGVQIPMDEIRDRLNNALIRGVKVLQCYEDGRKIRDLSLLETSLSLEYDRGAAEETLDELSRLFAGESLIVEKKGKNGITQQDIIPMIRKIQIGRADDHTVQITALHCCQNPTLNPMQLIAAVEVYLPHRKPDFVRCCRREIFDTNEKVFR